MTWRPDAVWVLGAADSTGGCQPPRQRGGRFERDNAAGFGDMRGHLFHFFYSVEERPFILFRGARDQILTPRPLYCVTVRGRTAALGGCANSVVSLLANAFRIHRQPCAQRPKAILRTCKGSAGMDR